MYNKIRGTEIYVVAILRAENPPRIYIFLQRFV